jgi:hypothetical protein
VGIFYSYNYNIDNRNNSRINSKLDSMTVSIWMRKNDVNVFNITKGRHVGFWLRDPGQEDVVQVHLPINEYKNLIEQL